MRPTAPILLATLGLLTGALGGSYWYAAHGRAAVPEPIQAEGVAAAAAAADDARVAFVDLDRKFVIPLVRANRVRALVVTELKLEVDDEAEERARAMMPRLRDAFLGTLDAMAVEGVFDGDLFSHRV